VAITDRIFAPVRRAFTGRPAPLSLAEGGKTPDPKTHGSSSVSYGSPDGSQRLLDLERRYELRGIQGGRTYRRMRRDDPHIYHLRRAQNLPIIGAAVQVDPADPTDSDAIAKQESVDRALLKGSLWQSFVRDCLLDADYGFSCFEICWFKDKVTGEARCRLELRPTSSIWTENIYVRNGAIDHVLQTPIDGPEAELSGDKIVWLAYDKEGDGFQGSPILRPMYQPWQIKLEMILELPILVRKGGGIPDITTDYEETDPQWAALCSAGRNYAVGPESFVIHDDRTTFDVKSTSVNVKDILDAIAQQNQEITSVCQAQVFDLGVNKAGSFALGKTLADAFHNGVQSQADYIASVLNADGGLIHQLVDFNFPTDDNRPILRFGNVETVDMRAMAQSLLWISQAFGSIPDDVREWALQQMNMPTGDAAQVVVQKPKTEPSAPAALQPTGQGADAAGGSSAESGAKASEGGHHHGLQLAEMRQPRGPEVYLNLAELVARFDDSRTAVRVATQATRDALAAELGRRARIAADKGQLPKFAAGAPPMVDKLTTEIAAVLSDFYAAGKQQVAGELSRQKAGKPWTPDAVGARIAAAEKPKLSPQRLAKDAAIAQQAEMAARSIGTQTQAAAATAAGRVASGVPVAEAVVETAIIRESDAAALRFAGIVSDLMSMGRTDEMAAQAQEIADYVYSALLDGATCAGCEPMDGEVTEDASLAESWAPNPECEGGDRCRCLVVAEISQDQGASA